MSEEMKQKAREFLSEYSDCNLSFQDGTIDRGTVAEAMAEFAAQVCEQREKERGVIVKVGDPILRKQCALASGPQGELLAKLWKVMDSAQAAGLAAPQIGVNARVAVVRVDGFDCR